MKFAAIGTPHPNASSYAKKFSGKYAHRMITGGVGYNLPQEAPEAFAEGCRRRGRSLIVSARRSHAGRPAKRAVKGKSHYGLRRHPRKLRDPLSKRMNSSRTDAHEVSSDQ